MDPFYSQSSTTTWNIGGAHVGNYVTELIRRCVNDQYTAQISSVHEPFWAAFPEEPDATRDEHGRRMMLGRHTLLYAVGQSLLRERPRVNSKIFHEIKEGFNNYETRKYLALYSGYTGGEHMFSTIGRVVLDISKEEVVTQYLVNILAPVIRQVMEHIDQVVTLTYKPLNWSSVKISSIRPINLQIPPVSVDEKGPFFASLRKLASDTIVKYRARGFTTTTRLADQFQYHPESDYLHQMESFGDLASHQLICCHLCREYFNVDEDTLSKMFPILACNATMGLLLPLLAIEDPMLNFYPGGQVWKRPGDIFEVGVGMVARTASGRHTLRLAFGRVLPNVTDILLLLFEYGENHLIKTRMVREEAEVADVLQASPSLTDSDDEIDSEHQMEIDA